jgi:hypothetical protein
VDVDFNQTSRQINALIRRLHGNYNSNTPIALQRHALGKLALQFRKWVKPGAERRWGGKKYNEFLEAEVNGSYKDFALVMGGILKDLSRLRFSVMSENWSKLSPREKMNFWRTTTELGFLASTLLVMSLLSGDDDDDDFLSVFALYQANRYITELTFYADFRATLEILKTPAATMGLVEDSISILGQAKADAWGVVTGEGPERYTSGSRRGQLKITKNMGDFFPLGRNIKRLETDVLAEQLKYSNM